MQHLNESYKSNNIKGFLMWAQTCAKEDEKKRYWDIIFVSSGKAQKIMYVTPQDGEIRKYYKTIPLGEIKDSQIYLEKFFTGKQAIKSVIKTDDVTIKTLCRLTEKSRTSCLVIMPDKEPKGEPTSVIFLDGSATEEIRKMLTKSNERKESKAPQKQTDRQAVISDMRQKFANVKKKYAEYRKKYGDKEAMRLSGAVNSLAGNPEFAALVKKNAGDLDKKEIAYSLYFFLLDIEDRFGFLSWMKKDQRLRKLYKSFHPDADMDNF